MIAPKLEKIIYFHNNLLIKKAILVRDSLILIHINS